MIIFACFCSISCRAGTSAPSSNGSSTPGPSALLRPRQSWSSSRISRASSIYSFQNRPYKGIRRTANATATDENENETATDEANATATDEGDGGATSGDEVVGEVLEERKMVTCLVQNKRRVRSSELCFACLFVVLRLSDVYVLCGRGGAGLVISILQSILFFFLGFANVFFGTSTAKLTTVVYQKKCNRQIFQYYTDRNPAL